MVAKKKEAPAKKAAKRPKKPAAKPVAKLAAKKLVGEVSHFFDKISVAVVEVKSELKVGDAITIEGPQTNIKQKVASMQVEHKPVQVAKKGQSIGMKVAGPIRKKDLVYKV